MSKKKNKYAFWNGDSYDSVNTLLTDVKQMYRNKYYNLWMSKYKWIGLDEEVADEQENFIMRKFWSEGKVAARIVDSVGLMVFASWNLQNINLYNFPSTVILVNEHSVSPQLIPSTVQIVNKDVVIGWCQPNHKPIKTTVDYYVNRLAQIELVINTNLQLQKMPFLIAVDENDREKMEDLVNRILRNEVVVFSDLSSLSKVQSLATQTPYIIDKLQQLKRDLEQELLTFFGIDNNSSPKLEQTHVSIDAINANNDLINQYNESITGEINKFLKRIKQFLKRDISIEPSAVKNVRSVHEEIGGNQDGE